MSFTSVCPLPQQNAVLHVLLGASAINLLWRPTLHAVQPLGQMMPLYAVWLKCESIL